MNYIVNIGSNKGNRELMLSRAIRGIMQRFGEFEVSHTVESRPWGFDSPHPFLNVCLMFSSDEAPADILKVLQKIELEAGGDVPHRNADGSYADRTVDIDIVAVDDMVIDTPDLKVPHPRLPERAFFLEPLDEIAPVWRHPVTGLTASEMLEMLEEKEKD